MGLEQIVLLLLGALAAGLVNGLTGFGTAITALPIWLYVLSPTAASTLAIICAMASQLQTLPMIWPHIRWRLALPLVIPGIVGVPIGTLLLPLIEPRFFRLGVAVFLITYSAYVLLRRGATSAVHGGKVADGVVGFGGGVLGGLAGVPGVLPIVWTDFRGWSKEQRRGVVQTFNFATVACALATHALTGLLTRQVGGAGGSGASRLDRWRMAWRIRLSAPCRSQLSARRHALSVGVGRGAAVNELVNGARFINLRGADFLTTPRTRGG
jgi:uncharacterized protein